MTAPPHLRLVTHATVSGVHEHTRTISGRRNPISGEVTMEHISLGWFIHFEELDFSLCWGTERPAIREGSRMRITFETEPAA